MFPEGWDTTDGSRAQPGTTGFYAGPDFANGRPTCSRYERGAGFVLPEQERFDESRRGGDPGFREIPTEVDVATLADTHHSTAFDHTAMRRDPNLAFPIDRVRELARAGRIASVAPRHLSFMGGLTAPTRFLKESVPEMTRLFVDDGVDVALLIPV